MGDEATHQHPVAIFSKRVGFAGWNGVERNGNDRAAITAHWHA